MPKELYYNAFISYSHAADGKLAPALQSGLHRFACPLYRIRALRVFRDETNLSANPKLWSSIQAALAQAEYFVLLASEKAAASPWVKDEISFWLRERSPDTLLLVITDGEVQWDKAKHDFDWNTTTAVPKALEGAFREVPRYLDLRWARTSEDLSIKNPKFLDAIADIAATLHHRPKDEMIGEDVRLHRQTKRITATAIVSLTILLLTSVALAIYAAYEARVAQSRLTLFLETNRKRLARESVVQADRGRPDRGVLLALAALPREPYEHEQRRSLFSETSQSLHVFFDHLLSLVLPVTDGDESSMQLTLSKTADALWYSLIRLPIPTLTLRGTGAGFSPDGRWIVTLDGSIARVWDAFTGEELHALTGHNSAVSAVKFSPNGARIITASEDGTARVWDAVTGKELLVLQAHHAPVSEAAFSSDGLRISTFSWKDNQTARVWNAVTGKPLGAVAKTAGFAAISPDANRIVTTDDDGRARVRDIITGKVLIVFVGQQRTHFAAFSPDGSRVLTTSESDGLTHMWDGKTGKEIVSFLGEDGFPAFSQDGKRIVTYKQDGGGTGRAHVWDSTTGRELFGVTGTSGSAAFSPDSSRMMTLHPEGDSGFSTIRVWDGLTGDPVSTLRWAGQFSFPRAPAFSPDGHRMIVAHNGTVRIWDQPLGEPLATFSVDPWWPLSAVSLSADGRRVVAATGSYGFSSNNGVARVWEVATAKPMATLKELKEIFNVSLSYDGSHVAVTGAEQHLPDRSVTIWNAATGDQLSMLKGHSKSIWSLVFNKDGRRLVTGSEDTTARVWDLFTGNSIATLEGHEGPVNRAAFSPDETHIVTASNDQTARVWDAASGKQLLALRGHGASVRTAAFNPNGTRIITASEDGTVRVWDAVTGKELLVLQAHHAPVSEAAFSPDGRRIVTFSTRDNGRDEKYIARVWDAFTGEQIAILGHRGISVGSVDGESVMVSQDGGHLVMGSNNGSLRIWNVITGTLVFAFQSGEGYWGRMWTARLSKELKDGAPIVTAVNRETILSVGFDVQGKHVVAGSESGVVQVWSVPSLANWNAVLALAEKAAPVPLTKAEREQFGVMGIEENHNR